MINSSLCKYTVCVLSPRVISATFHVSVAKAAGASSAGGGGRHELTRPEIVYLEMGGGGKSLRKR
jgi:hypothetical protein